MTPRILLPLLFCPLLFTGCDFWDHGGDGEPNESVLLPLDAGNQWVMAFTRFDAEGALVESTTDTLRVVGDTTVAGERWAEIRCAQAPIGCIPGGFYANREDGVWKWSDPSSDEAPYLLYKFPAEAGDAYELPDDQNFTVTVRGTDEPVEVPAGTLSAYHYEFDTEGLSGLPVSEGAGRLDRYLVPDQGFAFIGCSYLSLNENGELDSPRPFNWELIAFEGN
jgi:hypothetical protein